MIRPLRSWPGYLPDSTSATVLDSLTVPDDGRMHTLVLLIYLALMLIIYLLGLSPKVIRLFARLGAKVCHSNK